ncbi:SPASM domain-containing protein [Candidatus Woesearchaeota archaeon]|nr:SPASM domain-containing protein [Candidatus Woesearchaeota archaeon]
MDHPDIGAIFDSMASHSFRTGIITNGDRLVKSPELVDRVLAYGDWVRFSVDGFTEPTYRRVHGRKDISYQDLKAMIASIAARADGTTKVGVKILISRLNADDALLALGEALEMGVDYLQYKFLGFPERLVLDEDATVRLSEQIQDQIRGAPPPLVAELVPAYKGVVMRQEKCLMTFLHPVVDWDGEIYVCAFFEHRKKRHSIGNIHDGGFLRHWFSERHLEVFGAIDPATCVPNCPMLRYNPVIDYIAKDHYRFRYI